MKKIFLALALTISFLVAVPTSALSVNDFYFSDFTGDYYLSKDAEGISHLRVKESVTAVFPDYNQNKGICRQIPFTNHGGNNITLPNLTRANITVTRNGESEPIYSIEKEGDYYSVCTGTEEFVLGEQTYVFEYEFEKVVTEFEENGRKYQELYWDTNGNGALQRFDSVTARVHFEDENVFTGDSWCYVGTYGVSGQDRCKITKTSDGVEFVAKDLKQFENLTFDVELMADSFVIPAPEEDYTYVWLLAGIVGVCLLVIGRFAWKFKKSRGKANYYKGIFVKPEYQPSKDYSLAEMAEVYIGKKKDAKVAMLLELIVGKKVELKKLDKRKWSLLVNNLDGVGEESIDLLTILNDGSKPAVGDEIAIKRHSASSKLIALRKSMESEILSDLKKDELVEKEYNIGGSGKRGIGNVIAMTIVVVPVVVMLGVFLLALAEDFLNLNNTYGKIMVGEEHFYGQALLIITLTVMICVALSDATQKYSSHTNKGLEASRYMDGLKLYIEMAEAERLKMLQSVEGADTSPKGIVKLYEKLLPYAAVFGLEESWMNEMREYCEVEEIEEPDYLLNGLAISEITRSLSNAATYATTATTMSSSGGGSSSGFSGGGGGGFSGGGGGGGGFSGR
jgi:uncharacterized membrane protein YgcG